MTLDDSTKQELLALLKEVVTEAVESHPLTPEEIQWVRLAIQAEAERAALRKAIIEKSLAGLIWAGLATGGGYLINWFMSHWK